MSTSWQVCVNCSTEICGTTTSNWCSDCDEAFHKALDLLLKLDFSCSLPPPEMPDLSSDTEPNRRVESLYKQLYDLNVKKISPPPTGIFHYNDHYNDHLDLGLDHADDDNDPTSPPPPPPPSPPPSPPSTPFPSVFTIDDFLSTQLPSLEHRPSSPVTLPSFNSFIRGCSPPAPHSHGPHLTRHPSIQSGPLSSGPHLKSWKSENISMVLDQPSSSTILAGQQLNLPAPSLSTGYPGMRLLLGDGQRKSRIETQIKQLIALEFNGEHVTQYKYIQVPHSASVETHKTKNLLKNAILTLEAPAIPSSYLTCQASCCRTSFSSDANSVKTSKFPTPTAIAIQPDPAMPLQPRTPGIDSVLPPLGSDLDSNLDSDRLLRRIREANIRASRLPFLDLPSPDLPSLDLPPLCGHSYLQQQPPPSTSTSTRIRRPATAPYLPQSQQRLAHPTSPTPTTFPAPTTRPNVDWTTRSFTPLDSSPQSPRTLLSSSYSIPILSTQPLPSLAPHYPPGRFSRTATQVGGTPPSILERRSWRKVCELYPFLLTQ